MSRLSRSVISNRDNLMRSLIEAHMPKKEHYTLVAREVFIGVVLLVVPLVYMWDSDIRRCVSYAD